MKDRDKEEILEALRAEIKSLKAEIEKLQGPSHICHSACYWPGCHGCGCHCNHHHYHWVQNLPLIYNTGAGSYPIYTTTNAGALTMGTTTTATAPVITFDWKADSDGN